MIIPDHCNENQAAYQRLKPTIDQNYPRGRFVAINEGKIEADAATFEELDAALTARGLTSRDILVVQAGVVYPDYMDILVRGGLQ